MARERLAAASRCLAAVVGTLPPALLAGVAMAVHAPLARDLRFALGYGLTLPAWVAAMCLVFLVRRPLHAWLWCLLASVLLLLLVACAPPATGWRHDPARPAARVAAARSPCGVALAGPVA